MRPSHIPEVGVSGMAGGKEGCQDTREQVGVRTSGVQGLERGAGAGWSWGGGRGLLGAGLG